MKRPATFFLIAWVLLACSSLIGFSQEKEIPAPKHVEWSELPAIPNELGVAGPFAGVHDDVLIVAGGANFPKPTWETDKVWHDDIFALVKEGEEYRWLTSGKLTKPMAYGASVSTPFGVLCLGGNDSQTTFDDCFLLAWDKEKKAVVEIAIGKLPQPCVYSSATLVKNRVYLIAGQTDSGLDSATTDAFYLDLPSDPSAPVEELKKSTWKKLPAFPGSDRAFHLTIAQHNGFNDAVYVISGRRLKDKADDKSVEFLKDVWEFDIKQDRWRQRSSAPQCVMAGVGIDFGQSHLLIAGGADGSRFFKSNELKDAHPGFPKEAFFYHTITDTWTSAGKMPANHVTTVAVRWNGSIIIPSGEVRPRVRSNKVWKITPKLKTTGFGATNYIVLFGYLAGVVGVGFWFARRNKNTDDYFRGGKSIPWWAAGCSIFATMLSSLTYTGVPAKSYAQDWVYAIGNFMIPLVAVLAVFVALPFFRRIDATSAYEYLEKRFNRGVRLFGSGSFTLFHIFRMAVVMSLTALALAVATPLTATQSVLLMGALSILYCSAGGIEAVIWTDTVQTVVLLLGAVVALGLLLGGADGGWSGFLATASESEKFRLANFHWDASNAQIALWVIIAGGVAQNLSSYTSDQAVVQRYMTTADQKLAARSIWTNAFLTIPATLLFFGIGSALFVYYHDQPEKLDPTIKTDQIFPMFIAMEMPIGIAGLLVAGIFAAAQSTVSTSMNSTATTIVVDFLKPYNTFSSDKAYLNAAKWLTVALGVAGTGLALLFINPDVKSLFDEFIKVIGLFMGVLGGLFVLGVCTRQANGAGAMTGGIVGAIAMICLWKFTPINGYLYTAAGISICVITGYFTSLATGGVEDKKSIVGLTLFD